MILQTERLALARLTTDDAPFVLELLNDATWIQYIGDRGVRNLDDARKYILNGPVDSYEKNGFGLFLTTLKQTKTPIGMCGLLKRDYLDHVDVGFGLLPEFRGKGYATESAAAVIEYGKNNHRLSRIEAIVQSDNDHSIRVLEKMGFVFQRHIVIPDDDAEISLYGKDLQFNS